MTTAEREIAAEPEMDIEEDDDEYEETTFLVELTGLFDSAKVRTAIAENQCCMINVDSEEPILQIGSSILIGKWTVPLGNDIIFRESSVTQSLKLEGVGDRRLVAEKAIIVEKNADTNTKT